MQRFFIPLFIIAATLLASCGNDAAEESASKDDARTFLTEHYVRLTKNGTQRDSLVGCKTEDAISAAVTLQNKDTMCAVLRFVIAHQSPTLSPKTVADALNRYYLQSGKKTSMKRLKASVADNYAQRGDTMLAKRYLLASMGDTIPGKWQIAKDVDENGKHVARVLIAKRDWSNATQTYLMNLQTCDSILTTIARAQKEEVGRLRGKLENILLYIGIALLLALGTWVFYRLRNGYERYLEDYGDQLRKMQNDVETYQEMIDKLEDSNNSNERSIRVLEHLRDTRQERIMERLAKGKVVYELVKKGEPLPVMMKDADILLIEYLLMMQSEHYDALRQQYKGLTPRLFTYLILTDMGHSDTKIQHILSISPSSVRSLKSRLNSRKK